MNYLQGSFSYPRLTKKIFTSSYKSNSNVDIFFQHTRSFSLHISSTNTPLYLIYFSRWHISLKANFFLAYSFLDKRFSSYILSTYILFLFYSRKCIHHLLILHTSFCSHSFPFIFLLSHTACLKYTFNKHISSIDIFAFGCWKFKIYSHLPASRLTFREFIGS